jgi:uncharacterized membrane protein YphA (DoxX/SURF4 family)
MTAPKIAGWLAVPARWYLGLLFVGACLHKIADPYAFAVDVATYGILPLAVVNLVAITLPWVELGAGGMLIAGWRVRAAALLVAGMIAVFAVALIVALARGLDMSCGCFASQGAQDDPISRLTVLRDLAWFALAVFVLAFDRGFVGVDRWLQRRHRMRASIVFLGAVVFGFSASAQTHTCEALSDSERRLTERILTSEHPYDCCDDTISKCLQEEPTCALAERLADNVCRRVATGQDESRIRRALSRRARSMVGGSRPAEFDLSETDFLGNDDAEIVVVVYACARCPYCSRLVPAICEAITAGSLHGEIRLAFRVFPIRGHEGSTAAGLGFAAAADMGAFWPFMLHAYQHFDDFTPDRQVEWAAEVGLDRDEFEKRMADPATREALVASKKEGLANGVEETPTLFINGRRWVGDLDIAEVLDALEEEVARVKGKIWLGD